MRLHPITRSLRFRVTFWSSLIAAVVLVVGGLFMVVMLRRQMVDTIDRVLAVTGGEIGVNGRPSGLVRPVGNPDDPWFGIENSEFALQLLDHEGEFVTSSRVLSRLESPLVSADKLGLRAEGGPFTVSTHEAGRYRVKIRSFGRGERTHYLLIAVSLRDVDRAIGFQAVSLLVAVPTLISLLALLVWRVTGSALNPVDSIRREVDEITGEHLHRRVMVPEKSYELERLATTMNEMLDRLDSSAESQRQFVDDASHELRSPIAGIRGLLEVNLAHPEQAVWEETAPEMLSETLRMQQLVDDMMTLARGDARRSRIRSELVDLDDLVLAEGVRLGRESDLIVDVSGVSAAQVTGDPGSLARVIRNLCDNAVRHTSSLIRMTLAERPGEVVFAIEDDGPGVDSALAGRIFERFTRLDSARDRDSGGSGLGLAITKTIVIQHGGTIELDSTYEGGARFVVTLPTS